ncbi:MAG: flagellar type III secretion system pore protein FliP [Acidimicrobiales bacterium]
MSTDAVVRPLGRPSTISRLWPAAIQMARRLAALALVVAVAATAVLAVASPAAAQNPPEQPQPDLPEVELRDDEDTTFQQTVEDIQNPDIAIQVGNGEPSQSVLLIVGLAILSLAPSLVVMLTSFTRIVVVLSLTRNALGLQGVPPNQVLVGLALFLTLFVMAPTFTEINDLAIQPYLDGVIGHDEAYQRAEAPLRAFMLDHTRAGELELMLDARGDARPDQPEDVAMSALVPAFLLSELKTAFIMGFVIFLPFLVIDIVVSASLMSLGMMMLPPVFVSLPFKLLLFVMVGGWSLIAETLLTSFA